MYFLHIYSHDLSKPSPNKYDICYFHVLSKGPALVLQLLWHARCDDNLFNIAHGVKTRNIAP